MKIKNEMFYVLEVEDEKEIFQTEEEAIQELRAKIQNIGDVPEEEISIVSVDVSGEWKVQQVSWNRIALQLLKGG